MNNVICAIARNENIYINEWVKHHLKIGFNHIYLYDNNNKTDPFVGDFIDKDLLDKVTIIDYRERRDYKLQLIAYQNCYDTYDFDWCFYIDIDEFLVGVDDVNEWLSRDYLKDKEQIKVKINLFGDDDCIERDMSIPVMDFFKKIINGKNEHVAVPLNKCLVRGHVKDVSICSCHFAGHSGWLNPLITCTPNGQLCEKGAYDMHIDPPDSYEGETIFLNHYQTKTLKEFLDQKYGLVWVLMPFSKRGIEYYWYYNDKTPEKLAYIEKYLAEHNLPLIDNGEKLC